MPGVEHMVPCCDAPRFRELEWFPETEEGVAAVEATLAENVGLDHEVAIQYKDEPPVMTAERMFGRSSNDPIVTAFLHCERLRKIRKLNAEEWKRELEAFALKPR